MTKGQLEDRFLLQFNYAAKVVAAAPGRINLIGEHTDYNEGLVMPASIDCVAMVALRQNKLNQYRLIANDLDERVEVAVDKLVKNEKQWANYLLGVVDQLRKRGHEISGFDCSLTCDVPTGAGLSSSAAIECAIVKGLDELFNLGLEKWEMVRIGQASENEFVGANTGMLDQFASIFGEADTALLLDCRSLEVRKQSVNLPGHQFVVLNTGVKHNHMVSGYADRRADCERAVELLKENGWEGTSLRDLNETDLKNTALSQDENASKRATFIFHENQRVADAAEQLDKGDVAGFGESLTAGHWGLSKDYEVSCVESDFIVQFSENHAASKGARQMGGGFGGCVLCVVQTDSVTTFIAEAQGAYFNQFAITLEPLTIKIGRGASIIS
ncbi:MAG: galactokinase [Saprospiraceae bacterium]